MIDTHKKKNGRLWPIGIFIVYLTFVGMFIAIYIIGSGQKNDLVAHNYYEQELKYQQRIDAMKNVRALGVYPNVVYDKINHLVKVQMPDLFISADLKGKILFSRADDAALDFKQPLMLNTKAEQVIRVNDRKPGRWACAISWQNASKNYYWKTVLIF